MLTKLILLFATANVTHSLIQRPYRVTFILGGPASGKSTQCSKLVEDYGCVHLSAGDLLRQERASGSSTAELIETCITNGAIVPVKITLDLLRNAMERCKSQRYLIDGFPRNEDNLLGWEHEMKDVVVDSILLLDCPEDECERRILERSKTSGRSDDNLSTLPKRFKTFKDHTLPIVQSFERGGKSILRVDGSRPIGSVYKDVEKGYINVVQAELLELTNTLMSAVDKGDAATFTALTTTDHKIVVNMAQGNSEKCNIWNDIIRNPCEDTSCVGGFKWTSRYNRQSTMSRPHVRIMGKSAIVSFVRLIQVKSIVNKSDSIDETKLLTDMTLSCEETLVWELIGRSVWKNVHTHRVILKT